MLRWIVLTASFVMLRWIVLIVGYEMFMLSVRSVVGHRMGLTVQWTEIGQADCGSA